MNKKRVVSLIAGYLAALVLVLSGFIYKNYRLAQGYKLYVDNNYQHAFAELVGSVEAMDSALQKSLYATSPYMVGSVCTEVYGRSAAAMMALGELPFASNELENTAAFISKVGDYAYSLSRGASSGSCCTDEQLESLSVLARDASMLSQNLTELYAGVTDGTVTMSKLTQSRKLAAEKDESLELTSLSDSFKLMEREFPETPSLVYDGPFSQHLTEQTPKLIEGKSEISKQQALYVAAEFLQTEDKNVSVAGRRDDALPVYILTAEVNGSEMAVEVTVSGGVVLNMSDHRPVNSSAISADDAAGIAAAFLKSRGYDSMKQTYQYQSGNAVTVNFAYTEKGVICYPDLIKVRVALDNGGIINFEGLGYLMSHTGRSLPEAKVSTEEAQAQVSKRLKILSHRMAVIPTSGKNEKFCHEFKCENEDGRHYLVYIGAESGIEEDILILLENDNGTLTL